MSDERLRQGRKIGRILGSFFFGTKDDVKKAAEEVLGGVEEKVEEHKRKKRLLNDADAIDTTGEPVREDRRR